MGACCLEGVEPRNGVVEVIVSVQMVFRTGGNDEAMLPGCRGGLGDGVSRLLDRNDRLGYRVVVLDGRARSSGPSEQVNGFGDPSWGFGKHPLGVDGERYVDKVGKFTYMSDEFVSCGFLIVPANGATKPTTGCREGQRTQFLEHASRSPVPGVRQDEKVAGVHVEKCGSHRTLLARLCRHGNGSE